MSLDDLPTTPLSNLPTLTEEVQDYLEYLDGLIDTPETYGWAEDTLRGIRVTIVTSGKVTPGQRTAIANIVSGAAQGDRSRERARMSRRYEGWRKS